MPKQTRSPKERLSPEVLAEATLAAQRAARDIVARLEADNDKFHQDSWRYGFEIARAVRGVPGVTINTKPYVLRQAVYAAYDAFAAAKYKEWGPEELLAEVAAAWSKVRYGLGEGPLELAQQHAHQAPLSFQTEYGGKYAPGNLPAAGLALGTRRSHARVWLAARPNRTSRGWE